MTFPELLSAIVGTVNPIKSIFGLYVLMFMLPLVIPLIIAYEAHSRLFDGVTNKVNAGAGIALCVCCLFVLGWAIFFLIYFTKQRTKNPQLYRQGFLTDYSVKGKHSG